MTRSQTDRSEATRERVEQAAVQAFADKGFHGTTTRDIAMAAGMSPAGLYVHHRSKEELLYTISRGGHDRTLAILTAASAQHEDATDALRAAIYDFAYHHATWNTGSRVVNYELAALSPEHLDEILGIRRQIDTAMRSLVARGVAAGAFDVADVDIAAAALLSLSIDLARWYRSGGRWSPDQVAESYAAMALRMVGASDPH